jgi:hypothetical protein
MKKALRPGCVVIAGLLWVMPLAAQTQKPLIELNSFYAEGLGDGEARLIGNLVQSYLSDFGEVISPTPAESPQSGRLPDFIVSGSIYLEKDMFKFVLEVHNAATQETSSLTLDIRSMSELVLKARSLVQTAFSSEIEVARSTASIGMSEKQIIGTWRGERGVELIRLYNSGRGIAAYSSGVRMNLSWDIAGQTLTVQQISPNVERFYFDFPPETVTRFVEQAEPIRWELGIFGNGNILRGERIFTTLGVPGEIPGDTEFIFGQREAVEWTKSLP